MRIGIVGSGMIGGTLGALWARAGHEVVLSSRHPASLEAFAGSLGAKARAGTVAEALEGADAVLLAIPYHATAEIGENHAAALAGKVVLDAGNPYPDRDPALAARVRKEGRGSGVVTAALLPGARIVKAFNTVFFRTLAERAFGADPLGIPLASHDAGALAVAATLVRDAGFEPIVVGSLPDAASFDPGTPVWNTGASAREVRRVLDIHEPSGAGEPAAGGTRS